MCNKDCPSANIREAQGHSIVVAIHQIDELGAERDYWHERFDQMCSVLGVEPNEAILNLSMLS